MKKITYIICATLMCMHSLSHAMNSSFIKAIERGDLEEVQMLIDTQKIDLTYNKEGTALGHAVRLSQLNIIRLLLQNGAPIDAPIDVSRYGRMNGLTPLMAACYVRNINIVNVLLQAGANVNIQSDRGDTVLGYAIRMISPENVELVKLLLQAGVNVNIQNNRGGTALMMAAQRNYTQTVELLLQAGADVNLTDRDGFTVLMMANVVMINSLLQAGADITTTNNAGMTAYQYAIECKSHEKAELLLNYENMLNELDRQAKQLIASAKNKSMGLIDHVIIDETVIFDLIKYYRFFNSLPVLMQCLNWGIIKENYHKKLILNKAIQYNDIAMIQALIGSEYQITKNILQDNMGQDIKDFLEKYLAIVETLYTLHMIQEKQIQITLGLMPKELMSYLVSWLAIEQNIDKPI